MRKMCDKCKTEIDLIMRWEKHKDDDDQAGMSSPCNSCKNRDSELKELPCEFCTALATIYT